MNVEREDRIGALLEKGVREGIYPGAVLLVAKDGEIVFFQEAGHRSLIPRVAQMRKHTIFDLASLTKPLGTTLAIMRLVDDKELHLDQPLVNLLPGDLPEDKGTLTPRLLLSHCAGFADWKPFYLELVKFAPGERKRLLRDWITEEPLIYPPGTSSLYSDLGFIILEWVVEEVSGMAMHRFLEQGLYQPLLLKTIFFGRDVRPLQFSEGEFAPTESCPWRKEIVLGYVQDENAYVLGGYSGHAGLFGVAEEVYSLLNLLRARFHGEGKEYLKPETVRTFFTRQGIAEGSTWALGWDTPSPQDSSSGRYLTQNSVGHLGFTGTSIWMDLEKDVIVVFLTNRIHPTRNNQKIKAFRPRLHDLIMEELGEVGDISA